MLTSLCSAWPLTLKGGPRGGDPSPWKPWAFLLACLLHLAPLDNDEVAEFLQFFLPVFKFLLFCSWILIEPVEDFIILVQNLLFVLISDLAFKSVIFSLCFHIQCSEFKWISGIHLVSSSHIQLCPSEPLDHMLSVSFAQRALVIYDGDLVLFSCTLMHSRVTWDANGILKLLHWK